MPYKGTTVMSRTYRKIDNNHHRLVRKRPYKTSANRDLTSIHNDPEIRKLLILEYRKKNRTSYRQRMHAIALWKRRQSKKRRAKNNMFLEEEMHEYFVDRTYFSDMMYSSEGNSTKCQMNQRLPVAHQ